MTIVAIDELTGYMGQLKLTTTQKGITESVILPGVQQQLENYLNRPVEPVYVRESLRPNEMGFLYFRNTPIHEIYSVTRSDGYVVPDVGVVEPPIDTGDIRLLDEWGNPELYGYQLDMPFGGGYGIYSTLSGRPFYRVEYLAGYNGYVNEALKLDIMRVAAREVEMQFDDTMTIRGGTTEAAQDSDSRTKGWTEDELRVWDRLRRRVAV